MSNSNVIADTVLQKVQTLLALLIAVGTGKRNIDDAEPEYTQLRGQVSAKLRAAGVSDPNTFVSLWDWYSYWKDHGLSN